MQFVRRFRLSALFCAAAVLFCALVGRPFTSMGICDDGPYILVAQRFASTGHVLYNGWETPLLGVQLLLNAAFFRLFGSSFSSARMSTLLVAVLVALVLQRSMVRAGVAERNATVGTLALVLSPLFLMLSVTGMTDITCLFGILLCFYGCLRSVQAVQGAEFAGVHAERVTGDDFPGPPDGRSMEYSGELPAVLWLCFAVAANVICGTARQLAWLGALVMVPSALALLRSHRRTLVAGALADLAGIFFMFGSESWFRRQPYTEPERLTLKSFPILETLVHLLRFFLDAPFLLLPLFAMFLPQVRRAPARVRIAVGLLFCAYLFLALYPSHLRGDFPLEPMLFNGNWVSVHGIYEGVVGLSDWHSTTPLFLGTGVRVLLTLGSLGGLCGLLCGLRFGLQAGRWAETPGQSITWRSLGWLLGPFAAAYIGALLIRAPGEIFDRYLLPLLMLAALVLVRYYQERVRPQLPATTLLMVLVMAIYGVAVTHNMFSLYRARVVLAAELRAGGIPDTSVDNGWEYNFDVEIQRAGYLNDPRIQLPAGAYVPVPPPPAGICQMLWYDETPHIHPLYGVSFQPGVCAGPAPFAPVHYSRWLAASPGTLYVVRYVPRAELPPGLP